VSILAALTAETMRLRKARDPLAGSFQATLAGATANAKERALKEYHRVNSEVDAANRQAPDFSAVKANDEDALRAVQKSVKQVNDTLALKPDHAASQAELELLTSLLPRMASEDEVRGEAESFLATLPEPHTSKQIGQIMGHLTKVFGTSLDKAKASGVIKSVLA
jgi:uncharacterized protein YqeY